MGDEDGRFASPGRSPGRLDPLADGHGLRGESPSYQSVRRAAFQVPFFGRAYVIHHCEREADMGISPEDIGDGSLNLYRGISIEEHRDGMVR